MKIRHMTMTAGLLLLLAACGGGGGGDSGGVGSAGPASLASSTDEAVLAAESSVGAAESAAEAANSMAGIYLLFGGSPPVTAASPRRQPAATEQAGCEELLPVASACSGSVTITSAFEGDLPIPAGTEADIVFDDLRFSLEGNRFAIDGGMLLTFIDSFSGEGDSLADLHVRVVFTAMTVEVNGLRHGPVNDSGEFEITEGGGTQVTVGSRSYRDLEGVSVTGPGDYRIGAGAIRLAYRSDTGAYADITLAQWRVGGGLPQVGSRASVIGANGRIEMTVTASSATETVYATAITIGGATTNYVVTARYPAGGGAPSYTAVSA